MCHRPAADPRLDESQGRHAHLVAGRVPAIYARPVVSRPLRRCVGGRNKPCHDGYFLCEKRGAEAIPA